MDVTKAEDLKSAFGAFGGVRYWVNPTMAVGGEIEYFGAKSEGSVEVTVSRSPPVRSMLLSVLPLPAFPVLVLQG